jgi:hypothetical protein
MYDSQKTSQERTVRSIVFENRIQQLREHWLGSCLVLCFLFIVYSDFAATHLSGCKRIEKRTIG